MNPKNTWLLVVLAAGLFAFIWLVEPRLRPPPPVAPRVMPAFNPADVTSIQIQPKDRFPFRVERTNGAWLMTKPVVYPVKAAAVENFLQALGELSPRTRITAEELRKVRNVSEEYGFDSRQAAITLEFGDDKRQLLLGSATPMQDGLYAQLVGTDSVDVINADFLKFVPRVADDWRDTTFVSLAGLDFDRISVIHGDRTIDLALDPTNKLWRMTRPPARADNHNIENLLVNLQSLRVNKFVTDDPATNLQQYGLQPPQLALAFSAGTNRLFSLQFGNSPADDSSLVYARSNAQSTVVLLPRDLLAGWSDKSDDFRERHLLDVALNPPDLIEVSGDEDTFKVQKINNGVWVVTDSNNPAYRADDVLMRAFLQNLARLQVAGQPPDNKYSYREVAAPGLLLDFGLGGSGTKPFRSYILTHSPAPASTNELDFGILTNGYRLAKRTDESSVVAVTNEAFTNLPSRALQLRERRVWYFDATNVTRLILRDNGKTQIWEHKGPYDWDTPEVANNNSLVTNRKLLSVGIETAVTNLADLQVLDWVERGDTNRAKYNIDDNHPRIAMEVTQGRDSRTFSIDFGSGLDNGSGAYASVPVFEGQNWTNWIVVISAVDVENFHNWLPEVK